MQKSSNIFIKLSVLAASYFVKKLNRSVNVNHSFENSTSILRHMTGNARTCLDVSVRNNEIYVNTSFIH